MGSFADVFEHCALEDYAVFEALGDEPGEIYGCVDADGGEACGGVEALRDAVLGEHVEL